MAGPPLSIQELKDLIYTYETIDLGGNVGITTRDAYGLAEAIYDSLKDHDLKTVQELDAQNKQLIKTIQLNQQASNTLAKLIGDIIRDAITEKDGLSDLTVKRMKSVLDAIEKTVRE